MTGAASRAITVLMAAFPVLLLLLLFLRFGLLSGKPTPQSAGGSTTSPALITYMGCSFTTCWRDPFRAHFPSKYGNPCRNAESELMSYRGRKFLLNKTANLLINSVGEKGNWEGCQVVEQKVMLLKYNLWRIGWPLLASNQTFPLNFQGHLESLSEKVRGQCHQNRPEADSISI